MYVTVRHCLAAAAAVALLLGAPRVVGAPADSAAIEQLRKNVDYWRARGKPDKVAEAWRKILSSDPGNPEALQELALYEARAGRKDKARRYVEQLERAHPSHPAIPKLKRLVDLGSKYDDLLKDARDLWNAGKKEEALKRYQAAMGAAGPQGELAIEYYTRLGSMDGGWDEARAGLERLVKENPDNSRYKLALAKHLTYRPATRRDGIARLAALADDPTVGPQAKKAWKKALDWLAAKPSDGPLFEHYFSKVGKDPELAKKLAEMRRPAPTQPGKTSQNPRLAAAYRALDAGKIDQAEALFSEHLKRHPKDVVARHGLAMVAMARRDFETAKKLLEEVKARAHGRRSLWKKPLAEVEFWLLLQQAEALRVAGKQLKAEGLLKEAIERFPTRRHHADFILGTLLLGRGKLRRARAKFEGVLQVDPKHVGALRAMVDLALAEKRYDEAKAMNARLAEIEASLAVEKNRLECELLRSRAAVAREEGRLEEALELLGEARAKDPTSAWVLHDLVHLHLTLRDVPKARAVLDQLLAMKVDPRPVAFQVVRAQVLMEEGRTADARAVMATITVDPTQTEIQTAVRRLDIRMRAGRLAQAAATDASGGWRAELEALEKEASNEPEMLALVALAWSRVGVHDRALALAARVKAKLEHETASLKLMRGAIMLGAGRDRELAALLSELGTTSRLSAREKADHDALRVALAVRRADAAREAGNLERAFSYLRPLIEELPERHELLAALGRLFVAKGDHDKALTIYERLLRLELTEVEEVEIREAAIRAALALDRDADARRLRDEGLEHHPKSAAMLLVAARMAGRQGDDREAADYLRRARMVIEAAEPYRGPEDDDAHGRADTLSADPEVADILIVAFREFGEEEDRRQRQVIVSLPERIAEEEARIEARYAADVSAMPGVRYRLGVPGLGQLTEFTVPLSASLATGYYGRLRLIVTPVVATNGTIDPADPDQGDRLGGIGLVTLAPDNGTIHQLHTGVAIELGWAWEGLWLHLGTTPLGFPLQTFVGGLRYGHAWSSFGIAIEGGRRVVNDSLLSLAGLHEPVTGRPWGLVTANGGRLDLWFGKGDVWGYLFGGYEYLMGEQDVVANHRGFGGVGLRWRVYEEGGVRVRTGASFGAMGYAENLRHFTLGHGGYFSPQAFINGAVPIEVRGRQGRLRYDVDLDLGLNWFSEDAAPWYPGNGALQQARARRLDVNGDPVQSVYPGQSGPSFAANLEAWLGYEVFDQLVLGAQARLHYAMDYTEIYGGLFLGYSFGELSVPTFPYGVYGE